MLFHSPPFFVFFAGYFLAHCLTPPKYRIYLIITGGAIFYAYWNPWLTWVPFLLAFLGWAGAMWISSSSTSQLRRMRLIVSIILLALPLLIFKYTNFVYQQTIQPLLQLPDWTLNVPLPLGVSFVTFTMIAYVVDYYRGIYPLESRFRMVAAYMIFFPHLIAGPILRPREIIPQLDKPCRALDVNAKLAILLFTLGLAKKTIFAGQFADVVDQVYSGASDLTNLDYLLGIYGFSLQIYCDFSGYTDMAIGLAVLIGVRLPNNFSRPYISASVGEFWRRWHMTLSFWLRDYIYIPLGGNRASRPRRALNIMVTMILGGLWHGANWTFVFWGASHGAFIVLGHFLPYQRRDVFSPLLKVLAILITFHIVTILWIPFRAPNMSTVWRVAGGPFTAPAGEVAHFLALNSYSLFLLVLFAVWHPFDTHGRLRFLAMRIKPALLWPMVALVWAIAVSVSAGSSSKFIYFDF